MAYGSVLAKEVDASPARKARGAFFTPPQLADYLLDFAARTSHDHVLEPSCGEGEFLRAAVERFGSLGLAPEAASAHVVGVELHPLSARAASERLRLLGASPRILVRDFFEVDPGSLQITFDAVVGNPPYIRYQEFSGIAREAARRCALAAGVRVDALASSWAPFVVHASRFLVPGGRLSLVLPSELLATNYAAPVRRFLLERFSQVRVVLFERPVFPEVQEEVVLLLADGYMTGASDSILLAQVDSVDGLSSAAFSCADVRADGRWPVGRADSEAFGLLGGMAPGLLCPLSEYGRLRLGAVTGNNSFFTLSEKDARDRGLVPRSLTRLCPSGSRHLRRLSLDQDAYDKLVASGAKALLFTPGPNPTGADLAYIRLGEQEGVSHAYKCRTRTPWWVVPGVRPCDVFFTYMNGAGPNLCENPLGLAYLNSVHGLDVRDEYRSFAPSLLPIAALSSASLLSAELVGRSYGGGVLKLEPREASSMLLPSPSVLEGCAHDLERARTQVAALLEGGKRDGATALVDDVVMPALGLAEGDIASMRALLSALRGRRARRGGGRRPLSVPGSRVLQNAPASAHAGAREALARAGLSA